MLNKAFFTFQSVDENLKRVGLNEGRCLRLTTSICGAVYSVVQRAPRLSLWIKSRVKWDHPNHCFINALFPTVSSKQKFCLCLMV